MTKGEQMLIDLGYETWKRKNDVVFAMGEVEICFDMNDKTMRYEIFSSNEYSCYITIVFTYEELRAINQIMIDYGWCERENNK